MDRLTLLPIRASNRLGLLAHSNIFPRIVVQPGGDVVVAVDVILGQTEP
jgi:hypothetical protein